jgi:Domain of unknown function (DUF4291)
MNIIPERQIRAIYDDQTIRVYQAYCDQIANAALTHGTFTSPPFSMSRMTWIKPSFLWMMYRAGWGFKDENQKRILAIDISREGFEWALENSCSSHAEPGMSKEQWESFKASKPVRVQWDPERDIHHNPLPHRSIQIGLGPVAAKLFANEWIQRITEVTPLAHTIRGLIVQGEVAKARDLLPHEKAFERA